MINYVIQSLVISEVGVLIYFVIESFVVIKFDVILLSRGLAANSRR